MNMKFETLKEFWDWLTISTGDVEIDFLAMKAYMKSKDFDLLTQLQEDLFFDNFDIFHSLAIEKSMVNIKD